MFTIRHIQKVHARSTVLKSIRKILSDFSFVLQVHRLVVVDEEDKVIGIISLSDLLMYLVLRPTGECGGASLRNEHASIEEKDETQGEAAEPVEPAEPAEDSPHPAPPNPQTDAQSDTQETTQCPDQ